MYGDAECNYLFAINCQSSLHYYFKLFPLVFLALCISTAVRIPAPIAYATWMVLMSKHPWS